MWFLQVEEEKMFSPLPQPDRMCMQGTDVGGLACTHAHMYIAVLSAGCAVIHSVTTNTYCEKEKELPHVLS